jgi:hypothetical protein
MTESEWLACTDPQTMLKYLQGMASARKLRLFAVACCRDVWNLLDDLGRGAVEMAELFADGFTGTEEMRAARLACKAAGGRAVWYAAASDPLIAARNTVLSIQSVVGGKAVVQANLLRDILGNPFRPSARHSAWLTPAVVDLASFIYDQRTFDRLPDLATLLEDAGCRDPGVLGHLRGPGPHTRGCWLLDFLLGKE